MPPKKHPFCSMALRLVCTKEQFESIESDRSKNEGKVLKNIEAQITQNIITQEDLIIPRCGKIPNYEQFRSPKVSSRKDVLISGYRRLRKSQNLPNTETYELTERDLSMISYLKEKFGQQIINNLEWNEIFVLLIKQFEKLYHMTSEVNLRSSFQLPQVFTNQIISSKIIKDIFNYWRSIKTQINWFPLARNYWPSNQKNHHLLTNQIVIPFKQRTFKSIELKLLRKRVKKGKFQAEGLLLEQKKMKGGLSEQRLDVMKKDLDEKNERFGLSVRRFHEIVKKILPKAQKQELNLLQNATININAGTELTDKNPFKQQPPSPPTDIFKPLHMLSSPSSNPYYYTTLNKSSQTNFRSLISSMKLTNRTLPVHITVDEPEFSTISGQVSEIGQREFRDSLMVGVLGQQESYGMGKYQMRVKQWESQEMKDKQGNCVQIEEIEQVEDGLDGFRQTVSHFSILSQCNNVNDSQDTLWQQVSNQQQQLTVNSYSLNQQQHNNP